MAEEKGEKIPRTSQGLRDSLFDTIERMRDGEMDAATGKAIARAAHEICASVQLEIEVAKLRTDYPADMKLALPAALPLGIEQKK